MESREDKSLFQNHVFTFKISSFTTSTFLLIIYDSFIKTNDFAMQNRTHMGILIIPSPVSLRYQGRHVRQNEL